MAADSSANRFVAVPGTAAEKGALTMGEGAVKAKDWAAAATKAGCKPVLSIGGWSGSNTFSGLMATDTSRSDFVNTISAALDANGFVGADLDWEYPGKAGATNDFDTKNDLNNFLTFLKALRAKLGKDKLISADTSAGVWVGSDGQPSKDLSAFAAVLDFITIMTYDSVTYSAKVTGPNFALDSSCAPTSNQFAIPSTVKAWIDAKFPANKIMLGLASYGYAWKVANFQANGTTISTFRRTFLRCSGRSTSALRRRSFTRRIRSFSSLMTTRRALPRRAVTPARTA
ncbi:glycoside hydrolase superfamily [Rhodotorula toruloides]